MSVVVLLVLDEDGGTVRRVILEDFLSMAADLCAYASSHVLSDFLPILAVEADRYNIKRDQI